MITALTVKRYNSTRSFLNETEPFLRKSEFQNIFVLVMAEKQAKEEEEDTQGKSNNYCGAVWDEQGKLVFSLFNGENNTMLYGSLTQDQEAIDLLVEDLVASGAHSTISIAHGLQPTVGRLHEQLQKHKLEFRITDQVWAYESEKVTWSPKLLSVARDPKTELKTATLDDLTLLVGWTVDFFVHLTTKDGMDNTALPDPEEMVRDSLANNYVHILYVDGEPVSMCWMKRPTETACSLAIVFTPENCRSKGYGAVCVGSMTEKLLETRQSVNLFVVRDRDPVKNMYAGIGFKVVGEAARLRRQLPAP